MDHPINPDWWDVVRGERFRCTQCGRCCEQPGHVYFNPEEIEPIARFLQISVRRFLRKYAKRLIGERGYELRMNPQGICPFYREEEKICGIHPVKFVQCRTYPYWPENVESPAAWEDVRQECEGLGQGERVRKRDVRDHLQDSAGV